MFGLLGVTDLNSQQTFISDQFYKERVEWTRLPQGVMTKGLNIFTGRTQRHDNMGIGVYL